MELGASLRCPSLTTWLEVNRQGVQRRSIYPKGKKVCHIQSDQFRGREEGRQDGSQKIQLRWDATLERGADYPKKPMQAEHALKCHCRREAQLKSEPDLAKELTGTS